jgi:tetratricopeptide (TPR) repeat protein/type II secretory pathway predicted ATPase ExeA
VNVAARLEQAALPGDILVGGDTYRLVRHAVEAEPVAPLRLKGKAETLAAFRLLRVAPGALGRPERPRAPMVGRASERKQLVDAFDQAVRDRSCQLLTVLGAAGVGKSRLVAEATRALDGAATVAVGRCLPYGDGLTWWPLVEALGGATGLFQQVAADGDPAIARAGELLKPKGEPVAPEEALWAMRTVLETLARRRPLVLVVDDLHWAEPPFMDLLEHVTDRVHDAPLLLVVMARPDLYEVRPAWGSSRPNATAVLLEPLVEAEATDLLHHLLGTATLSDTASGRILEVAEGNPLFVEEVVAMLIDDGILIPGDGQGVDRQLTAIAIPPTIQALLAARLDRLDPAERAVIEAASVEGKEFTGERAAALVDGVGGSIGVLLRALVRKDLIRPVEAHADTFRFRHQLMRDAAYEGISKGLRAGLHERFADWLEARPLAIPVIDELLGYHVERAVQLRRELGESDEATTELAARASAHLGAAGVRAAQRDDPSAASTLLERAATLVEPDDVARGALLPTLGASLFEAGRMAEAISILDEAIARAPQPRLEARAQVERELVRLESEAGVGTERALRAADKALPVLEREDDDTGQCRAWYLRAQAAWIAGRVGRADKDWRAAADCARRAHDERELFRILGMRATAAVLGPTPVDDAIRRCVGFREVVGASPVATALMDNPLASLHAMQGKFELADRFLYEANQTLDQLGSLGWVSHHEALVRMLEGQAGLAELPLRAGIDKLAAMGDGELLATTLAMLAQAVYAQGLLQEADDLCGMAAGAGAAEDIVTEVIWRGVKAKILAHLGQLDEAEMLARDAVRLVAPTDLLSHRGDAMLDLAEVLRTCSRTGEYHSVVQTALSLYEKKGNVIGAARARSLLSNRIGGPQHGI